jgi:hypothetical protein
MKKIAFFVEGQTEQLFINKLLIEIAGQKNIAIDLRQWRGGSSTPKQEIFIPQTLSYTNPQSPLYEALIYDCGGDDKVKSDILDQITNLASNGYEEIIGIRDLFPLTDLSRLERGLQFIPPNSRPLPIPFQIIVAVNEIEAWFLAEWSHFECIDSRLTSHFIRSNVPFDPYIDDMTLRVNPAEDLNTIYQLVGKSYRKRKNQVERTVNCLDYANLYVNIKNSISKLNDLVSKIDNFLA